MSEPVEITLQLSPMPFWAWIVRLTISCGTLFGAIGLGAWMDSAAMQWAGVLLFLIIAFAARRRDKVYTPQQLAEHLRDKYGVVG